MKLFEILVPANRDVNEHWAWDAKVVLIAGGMSILPTIRGRWQANPQTVIVSEQMIPVRIAATDDQMFEIAQMTAKHYQQKSVMYYVISSEALIVSLV